MRLFLSGDDGHLEGNNMDFFGIGSAVKGTVNIYFQSARGTGRTTNLIESLDDGDRVVFSSSKEAKRVEKLCRERGINILTLIADPKKLGDIMQWGTSQKRTIFDHSFVEEYYRHSLESATKRLAYIERQLSGYGSAHRETKRKAMENLKWGK